MTKEHWLQRNKKKTPVDEGEAAKQYIFALKEKAEEKAEEKDKIRKEKIRIALERQFGEG